MPDGTYLIQGTATKNATLKVVGEKAYEVAEFSLAVGKAQDTTPVYANCKAWGRLAQYAAAIGKGDNVFALAKKTERTYNGKAYTDYVCDYLNVMPIGGGGGHAAGESRAPAQHGGFSDDDFPL
jgi:hypothetical protein